MSNILFCKLEQKPRQRDTSVFVDMMIYMSMCWGEGGGGGDNAPTHAGLSTRHHVRAEHVDGGEPVVGPDD